jgi:hypothetical protein
MASPAGLLPREIKTPAPGRQPRGTASTKDSRQDGRHDRRASHESSFGLHASEPYLHVDRDSICLDGARTPNAWPVPWMSWKRAMRLLFWLQMGGAVH